MRCRRRTCRGIERRAGWRRSKITHDPALAGEAAPTSGWRTVPLPGLRPSTMAQGSSHPALGAGWPNGPREPHAALSRTPSADPRGWVERAGPPERHLEVPRPRGKGGAVQSLACGLRSPGYRLSSSVILRLPGGPGVVPNLDEGIVRAYGRADALAEGLGIDVQERALLQACRQLLDLPAHGPPPREVQ